MKYQYDLIVIGSGSSGFSAASTAKKLGAKKILLVEKRKLGYSLCTNEGCMPSKTLIASASVLHVVELAKEFGINAGKPKVDWTRIQKRVKHLVNSDFFGARTDMIKNSGIPVVKGAAQFISPNEIRVGKKTYSTKKFVIATGSKALVPPIKGLDTIGYLDSSSALYLKKLPKSLIVIGGGYISAELASLFHSMGVDVTVLERGDYLLRRLDADIGKELQRLMVEDGVKVINNLSVNWVKKEGTQKIVCADTKTHGKEACFKAEEILVATGREAAIDGLNLEAANIKLDDRGSIQTNDYLQTSQKHIYAVGDVNGKAPLVYVGSMEGRVAANNMFGKKQRADYKCVSNIVFANPEIGTVGMTEQEALDAGHKIITSTTPMSDIGKAVALGETRGFAKLIVEKKSGKMLGFHILGHIATDIMQVALPHFYHGDTVFDVMNIPYPHPTLGEALAYPAEDIANILK
jgi:pyruvate/2-oxoglutarate dehydrogenase complex dihydrolipoamide dehydrogenase (E3) component